MRSAGMIASLVFVLAASRAGADTSNPQPWTVGVSEGQKAQARELLDAGNEQFLARKYADALDLYRKAVAAWDHPAIRFNIVRCLIQLEKPVEASDELKRALAYGEAPFEEAIYSEALGYEKLLASSTAELEVTCAQAGVTLTLDGQALPACPTKLSRRVLPGQHQVVGTKQGFLPRTVEVVVLGGKHERAEVTLVPLSEGTRIEHRWAQWMPWTVFASGFVIAGVGGLLHLAATGNMDDYRDLVKTQCANGCADADRSLESRANLENDVAISLFAVAGATIVTGSVMIYLNRGRTVLATETPPRASISVVPLRGGGGLGVTGSF